MHEAVITEAMIAARVRNRLRQEYRGVFPDDLCAYERALDERLAFAPHEDQLTYMRDITEYRSGVRVLDIGCGYGTFVLTCLRHGYDARGVDVAEFELEIARTRLRNTELPADPEMVFQVGDGERLHFPDRAFDVVTLRNTLEHVPRYDAVLREAGRLVCPGGVIFVTAPNYCAFRQEAHYQVPWVPFMPKVLATRYLRALRRDPTFLREHVYAVTNWGIIAWFLRHGYQLRFPSTVHTAWKRRVLDALRTIGGNILARAAIAAVHLNPIRGGITIAAQKPSCPP